MIAASRASVDAPRALWHARRCTGDGSSDLGWTILKLYEYQAKTRFAAAGVPVLPGRLCATPDEAARAAAELGGAVVVKAQVLAGGRGKAGGIRKAVSPTEAAAHAADLLGQPLLGLAVRRVWLEPLVEVERELYLAFALDFAARQVVFLLGPGGVEVEAQPEAIWRVPVDPALGLPLFVVRDGLLQLGLSQSLARPLHDVAVALLAALRANAATLVEVNPLGVLSGRGDAENSTISGGGPHLRAAATPLIALDARMVVDDGALEQVPELLAWVQAGAEEFPEEHLKLTLGFDYVELDPDGDVGLLSTGAGLTMTVIDLLRERGARPVNFVDLRTGGMGRDPTRLRWVLDRLIARPTLRAVLVNIFAGITNLEEFAHALLAALEAYPTLRGRVVVRATGTGFAAAEALWRPAGLVVTEDLGTAIELTLGGRESGVRSQGSSPPRASASPRLGVSTPWLPTPDSRPPLGVSRVIVQGITGRAAALQTRIMREYGTPLVGGVAPGRGGQEVEGLPVFDTVRAAVAATGADTSLIIVPAALARDAILEAVWGGIRLIVCVAEGVPVYDMLLVRERVAAAGVRLIGPNCPGLIIPGQARVGIMPPRAFAPGPIGMISRSGTLGYEIAFQLTAAGLGQSTFCGIGGDPIKGSTPRDLLPLFAADPNTKAIVLCGEIGGTDEEEAAAFVAAGGLGGKPAVAFIAGRHAPPERRMGHAGAIISGGVGTWESKAQALRAAGVVVAESPLEVPRLVHEALG